MSLCARITSPDIIDTNDERIQMNLDDLIEEVSKIPGATIECLHPSESMLHRYDEDSVLGDSYWCGVCGMLLQVG